MKNKICFSLAFSFICCFASTVFSQSTSIADNLHFTAVARDLNNNPIVSSTIYIRIEIFEGTPAPNNKIYCEQTPATTNQFGEFSLNFPNTSDPNTTFCQPNTQLSSVLWQTGNKWVKISFQPNGNAGQPFTDIATFQFTTVPYAFAARTAERLTNFNLTGATNGQVLKYDASSNTWKPAPDDSGISGAANGDLGGNYPNPTVDGIQGTPVSATAPQQGQMLIFDNGQWRPTSREVAIFEQRGNGAAGGVVAGFNKRNLNQGTNTPNVSLIGNTITLQPGTYLIQGYAMASAISRHQVVLRNQTTGNPDLIGTNEYSNSAGDGTSTSSLLFGKLTIQNATSFILDHWVQFGSASTDSQGLTHTSLSSIENVYARIVIEKI